MNLFLLTNYIWILIITHKENNIPKKENVPSRSTLPSPHSLSQARLVLAHGSSVFSPPRQQRARGGSHHSKPRSRKMGLPCAWVALFFPLCISFRPHPWDLPTCPGVHPSPWASFPWTLSHECTPVCFPHFLDVPTLNLAKWTMKFKYYI